jgi:hypothetical protein
VHGATPPQATRRPVIRYWLIPNVLLYGGTRLSNGRRMWCVGLFGFVLTLHRYCLAVHPFGWGWLAVGLPLEWPGRQRVGEFRRWAVGPVAVAVRA